MSFLGGKVVRAAIERGWLPNIVIGVLLLAITQASLWGFVFASFATLIFFVTSAKFGNAKAESPQQQSLYRAAIVIGYGVGLFCLFISLFWCFRSPIAVQVPQYVLSAVQAHAENARTKGRARPGEIPLVDGFDAGSIFGTKGSERYNVMSAENLSKYIFDELLTQVDSILFYLASY